jgi:3-dehydroquinate synthase
VQTLKVDVGPSPYLITIGAGLLGNAALIESQIPGKDLMVVTDTTVARLYLPTLRTALGDRRSVQECILAEGEQQKTLQTVR